MTTNKLQPFYFDLFGRKVADIEIHINNGNDVSLVVFGSFALNSQHQAEIFFNTVDFESCGLSSTALMYKGDNKNSDQFAGLIHRTKNGNYAINLLVTDCAKVKSSGIPIFGWGGELVKYASN